jgi:small subunit ribosomal protein S6
MTLPAPTYDLVILLDTQLEEPERAKIVADARALIEADGELLRQDDWGERALAYPIQKKTSAEYHLLQFHIGTPTLLDALERSLRIIDGVLRFRVVKLAPGVPAAPEMRASPPARASETEAPQPEAPREPATESASPPEQQPDAQPEPEPEPEVAAEVEVGDPA